MAAATHRSGSGGTSPFPGPEPGVPAWPRARLTSNRPALPQRLRRHNLRQRARLTLTFHFSYQALRTHVGPVLFNEVKARRPGILTEGNGPATRDLSKCRP